MKIPPKNVYNVPVRIFKILYVTLSGKGFRCWCNSSVGRIKKENKNVPDHLWDELEGKLTKETKLNWYQRLWNFIKRKLCLMKKYLKKPFLKQ